jgi:hypothetical protein
MGKQRSPHPDEYYNILRKEANFGCAKCGTPLVTFHHIEGYREDDPSPIEQLIALCNRHHKLSDLALKQPELKQGITKQELYELKKKPFNNNQVHHRFRVKANRSIM